MSITMASRKQLSRQARRTRRYKAFVYGNDLLRKHFCQCLILLACPVLIPATLLGQNPSPLASAGYAVLPVPQKVTLTGKDFALDSEWRLELAGGVREKDVAVESLNEGLATKFHLSITAMHPGRSEPGVI